MKVDPSEKPFLPMAEADVYALAAFDRVLKNGQKIELDHQLVYFTRRILSLIYQYV